MRNMWRSRVARRDLSEREPRSSHAHPVSDLDVPDEGKPDATGLCGVAPEAVTYTNWCTCNRGGHLFRGRRRRIVTGWRGAHRDARDERPQGGRRARPGSGAGLVAAAVIRALRRRVDVGGLSG